MAPEVAPVFHRNQYASAEIYDALSALRSGKIGIPFLFVGMSGAGKSRISRLLAGELEFSRMEVDAVLAERIQEKFHLDIADVEALGEFLGRPDKKHKKYAQKERQLLEMERQVMADAASWNVSLLDLSGSALYHPIELQRLLHGRIVVCMDVPKNQMKKMFHVYQETPKPVFFNGQYDTQKSREENYKALLQWRLPIYRHIANLLLSKWDCKGKNAVEVVDMMKLAIQE